ncbi:C2 domain-containing protein 3 [Eupeodes corollae]|uniref:C2 domain-containing protein 3 n=1 Tax=Eupeodes corollae TaxID=290404 RepID=UPI00248FFE00|nr:C2 domain-containing protein 3 [Eupeodes corollae]
MFSATTAPKKHPFLNGILQISGQRNFTIPLENDDIFLVCQTFWKEKALFAPVSEKGANLTETFSVTHNNQFLEKVQNNCLNIELSKIRANSNPEVIGSLRLPLHQFYIAYRDASLTNHLNDGQFPVISTNKWVSVTSSMSGEQIGELECFLAMGTEKQIENIKNSRIHSAKTGNIESTTGQSASNYIPIKKSLQNDSILPINSKTSKTSDLLAVLQKSLSSTSYISPAQPGIKLAESNSFRIVLEIKSARNLPTIQSHKLKKKINRSLGTKGSQNTDRTGEQPSTYVTFQAKEGDGPMVKSHEGMVYSTVVVEKNSNPAWNVEFCVSASVNYLINKHERFILKVWKRVGKTSAQGQTIPCPMEDAIIGFAPIDLFDLVENKPVINGWFDIVDFSGHINGQIHIVAKPVDDVKELKEFLRNNQVDNLLHNFESSLDINNMNLCRAIKRKFTELEEISERLKSRLLDVTGSAEVCKIARDISDEQLDEFEHDLNTSVCEDDNESFTSHTNSLNISSHSSSQAQ